MAGEDSAFFEHTGIDYESILRAAWVNLRAGGEIKQGASTITQQMVKGLLLSPERKLRRKIREMILARRIEQRFSKHEILYLYLNQIYFGHGAYGIGEAADGPISDKARRSDQRVRRRAARGPAEGAVALFAVSKPRSVRAAPPLRAVANARRRHHR